MNLNILYHENLHFNYDKWWIKIRYLLQQSVGVIFMEDHVHIN